MLPRSREEEYRLGLIQLLQDQARKVLDTIRALTLMMEGLSRGEGVGELTAKHQAILKHESEGREIKREIEKGIAKAGILLSEREEFLKISDIIDKIADRAEGIAFRVMNLVKANFKVTKDILKDTYRLSEEVLYAVTKCRESLMAITLSEEAFNERIKETNDAEKKVDMIFRELDFQILRSNMKIGPLLLIREIVHMLENIADDAEEAVGTLRALSVTLL